MQSMFSKIVKVYPLLGVVLADTTPTADPEDDDEDDVLAEENGVFSGFCSNIVTSLTASDTGTT